MKTFNELKKYIEQLGHGKSVGRVKLLLEAASNVTGQSTDEILECCDFKKEEKLKKRHKKWLLRKKWQWINESYFLGSCFNKFSLS